MQIAARITDHDGSMHVSAVMNKFFDDRRDNVIEWKFECKAFLVQDFWFGVFVVCHTLQSVR